VDQSGLLSITGGKWTTYRHMAEDCVDHAATLADLPERPCLTKTLNIHGFRAPSEDRGHLSFYGSDGPKIEQIMRGDPALAEILVAGLPCTKAEVVWAARSEMAVNVEDVLARRTRALFLNSRAAIEAAPVTGRLLAQELGRDEQWQMNQIAEFNAVARHFTLDGIAD
jgi:glycerol-3-phosphate dehydrogenase